MPKKDRAGFERKRIAKIAKQKAKKAKEAKARPLTFSGADLGYSGNRYKTEAYVRQLMWTETGIYEAFVIAERKLTDAEVRASIASLVEEIRVGQHGFLEQLPPPEEEPVVDAAFDLVRWRIIENWRFRFEDRPKPARADLVGMLRTIVHSLDIWTAKNPNSRGYLNYLEGFLGKLGVDVKKVSLSEADEDDQEATEPNDEFLAAGLDWVEQHDHQARQEFYQIAEDRILQGDANNVVEICQKLLGRIGEAPPSRELQDLAIRADRELGGKSAAQSLGEVLGR